MIRLVIEIFMIVGLVYLVKDLFGGGAKAEVKRPARPAQRAMPEAEVLVEDPQCGVFIPASEAMKGPDGKSFCSAECLEAYRKSKG